MQKIPYPLLLFFFFSCSDTAHQTDDAFISPKPSIDYAVETDSDLSPNPYARVGEIPLPKGYTRVSAAPGTYGSFLRNIKLKSNKTVYLYNGSPKRYQGSQFAVLDISVQNRDLQQCADAVMRLRAEYFYGKKQYDKILFIDNENGQYRFKSPYTRSNFDKYLLRVFGMCGSASLSKQMRSQNWSNLKIGDVLIKGGFPGHAVTIMDVAENS